MVNGLDVRISKFCATMMNDYYIHVCNTYTVIAAQDRTLASLVSM